MKRTVLLIAFLFTTAFSSGFSGSYDNGKNEHELYPIVIVHIMQSYNCTAGQENAKVTFRDLTTSTVIGEVMSGSGGYAQCSAVPGHLIGVYATYNDGGETCGKMIQGENGTDFGNLCLNSGCIE